MVKDLKIAVAISDLENFVKKKEKEEMEATRRNVISEEESSIDSKLPSKHSSQNYKTNGEINVEYNNCCVGTCTALTVTTDPGTENTIIAEGVSEV